MPLSQQQLQQLYQQYLAETGQSQQTSSTGINPNVSAVGSRLIGPATSDPSTWTQAPGTFGQAAGALGAAKGAYDTANGFQEGGAGERSGLTELGAGVGTMFGGPVGAVGGAALGNVAGYGLQGDGWKNHAALMAIAPGLEIARDLGVPMSHETTAQTEARRYGALQDAGVTNAQDLFAANHPTPGDGTWSTGPFAGKQWNFNDAETMAKADPAQFRNVYGNSSVFGNDWSSYKPEQQDDIISNLLADNLYQSKRGDVIITDADKAKEVRDQVLAGTLQTAAPTPIAGWDPNASAASSADDGNLLPSLSQAKNYLGQFHLPQQIINAQKNFSNGISADSFGYQPGSHAGFFYGDGTTGLSSSPSGSLTSSNIPGNSISDTAFMNWLKTQNLTGQPV